VHPTAHVFVPRVPEGETMKANVVACILGVAAAGECAAADLKPPVKAVPAPAVARLPAWAGPYLGVQAGYLSGGGETTFPGTSEFHLIDPRGFAGGVLAGYSIQRGRVVAGIEGDVSFVAAKANVDTGFAADPAATQMESRITWNGHLRGRVGYAFDQVMVFAGVENKAVDYAAGVAATWNDTRAGWTLGGGADFLVAPKVTVRLEYLYDNFGTKTLPLQTVGAVTFAARDHTLDTHTLRAGVNWRF
jgi:outer membrane immunogenic protein